jgi:hypothetical protein
MKMNGVRSLDREWLPRRNTPNMKKIINDVLPALELLLHKDNKSDVKNVDAPWRGSQNHYMKSLVPKRYISIFVYLRKMQSKFGIYWKMH